MILTHYVTKLINPYLTLEVKTPTKTKPIPELIQALNLSFTNRQNIGPYVSNTQLGINPRPDHLHLKHTIYFAFTHAVYRATQEIPPGKVTTYGHIARLIGTPQRPRQVGTCLKHLPSPPPSPSQPTTTTPTTTPQTHPSPAPPSPGTA
ncbi:hypothetical protein EYC80_008487 [Monilinia laxa]|uniref:Methylated-DNA-[protein]-cysteine S-methyltransferase DNA binding domain-containing protein n=1 Tax=Monilinia laxa TaxID=61186 RepID=A0A5N6JQD1_MONLA|nr:hypothetical protein EYC80_008487 [Monilinia laxa]